MADVPLRRRLRVLARLLAMAMAALLGLVVVALLAGILVLRSTWGQERIRRLALDQADRLFAASLHIERLEGTLLGGVVLHGVRLAQNDQDVVAIDRVDVGYNLRQFFGDDIVIRSLRVVRPRVVIARTAEGRWNLGTILKAREQGPSEGGGRRPVRLSHIEVEQGHVELRDPLQVGFANVPTAYTSLDATLSLTLRPRGWRVDLERASWNGERPYLERAAVTGTILGGPEGWTFERLHVQTPRSDIVLDGRVDETRDPTTLDLRVEADTFAFQEWAGIVAALENIAVEAAFHARLHGPTREFTADVDLASDAGDIKGAFTIGTAASGWSLSGKAALARLNLAGWLNAPERTSDITGDTTFALEFPSGRRFPTGTWTFDGTHAAFMEYEAGETQAAGRVTTTGVVIEQATATAYGANVRLSAGTIGIEDPFPFSFSGLINGLDLRRLPPSVPIPRVDTALTLDFEASGQFVDAFLAGRATFGASRFLDGAIDAGAVGSVDTSAEPVTYSWEGGIQNLSIERVAQSFDLGWLSEPRYRGTISGRFSLNGAGSGENLDIETTGRVEHATLFEGTLTQADVTLTIADGSLSASYEGRLDEINPAIPFDDERFAASVSGSGRASIKVDRLLVASPALEDYQITADLALDRSSVSGFTIDSATIVASLESGVVSGSVAVDAPVLAGDAEGRLPLAGNSGASIRYDITRADLRRIGDRIGQSLSGHLTTSGRVTGPLDRLRAEGGFAGSDLQAGDLGVLGAEGTYDAILSASDASVRLQQARVQGVFDLVKLGDEQIDSIRGTATFDAGLVTADLELSGARGADGVLSGSARLSPDWTSAAVSALSFGLNDAVWQLREALPPPVIVWSRDGFTLEPMTFTPAGDPSQHLRISGTWREDGDGQLNVFADGVRLESVSAALGQPGVYAGTLELDATVTGTRAQPIVTGNLLVSGGRVRQLTYEQLFGRIVYVNGMFEIGVRLDQAPGIWLTASGAVPLGLIDRSQPERPMHVAIASTPISLGLVEGLTDVISDVTGRIELNVSAVGTSHSPRFTGQVRLADAGFVVNATGVRYEGGNGTVVLTRDRLTVDALRLYDANGRVLDVSGTVSTEELRLRDLALDVRARGFQVLGNQYGTVNVDAQLMLGGRIDEPTVAGIVTIADGDLRVDRIFDRMLFQPYDVEAQPSASIDALTALNPWERLALDIALDVPGTLRMIGDNVQVAAGTPLGLGNINLRVSGNLFLRKEPGAELIVIGGFDELTGRYAFQGRRFDLDPASTVVFTGDLDPELTVTVTRVISGVETRVTIGGRLSEPALQLASNPPLDPSDILSLIVFNTSVNQLSLEQQEQLAVRAGTLAAGFLTAPLVSALERTLGLDILEIEAATDGARLTIGDEIAPGLVARFSRQFGTDEYDEATIEYYLSRLFRIRATFSDAGSVIRSPFRRVERAGIDLLLFFSF